MQYRAGDDMGGLPQQMLIYRYTTYTNKVKTLWNAAK